MAGTREENKVQVKITEDDQFKEITEGKAKILFPKANTVFYNNVQVFNRDLSVAVIKLFSKVYKEEKERKKPDGKNGKKLVAPDSDPDTVSSIKVGDKLNNEVKISILEALSASGLRAIRYALEIPILTNLIANDLSKEAVASIDRNINHNGVGNKVKSSLSDARYVFQANLIFDLEVLKKGEAKEKY